MPYIHAVCRQCSSRVPIAPKLEGGAIVNIKSHKTPEPCPHCGGKLQVNDGFYAVSSYKVSFSQTSPNAVSAQAKTIGKNFMYGDYVRKLSREFEVELEKIETEHNFEYGSEFELAICTILRRALPDHFGVCRGYVVDEAGNQEGDDIIIYDRMRFPRLRLLDESDVSKKQRIPIEAVYAYIEAKHTMSLSGNGGQSFSKAIQQVGNVKALCSTRAPLSRRAVNRYVTLGENLGQIIDEDWPPIRNPVFTAIFSRFVRGSEGSPPIEPQNVLQVIRESQNIPSPFENSPDLVVLGSDAVLLPIIKDQDTGLGEYVSPFQVQGSNLSPVSCADSSFGLALCSILYALDWIELGRLRWEGVIGEVVLAANKDRQE